MRGFVVATIIVGAANCVMAFDFEQFFGGQNRQQQRTQQNNQPQDYEQQQLNSDCQKYLCPETFACVAKPVDCPCPFPQSQIKCVFPDKQNFVCISSPVDNVNGVPVRDCKWVEKAWKGLL